MKSENIVSRLYEQTINCSIPKRKHPIESYVVKNYIYITIYILFAQDDNYISI